MTALLRQDRSNALFTWLCLTLLFLAAPKLTAANPQPSAGTPIRFGLIPNIPPYVYPELQKETGEGIVVDALRLTLDQLGLKPHFIPMTLLRGVASLNNNSIDAAFVIFMDNQSDASFDQNRCSSVPIAVARMAPFTMLEDNPQIKAQNFSGYSVGSYRFLSPEIFARIQIGERLTTFNSNELVFRALAAKRIDIAIIDEGTAYHWSKHHRIHPRQLTAVATASLTACFSQPWAAKPGFIESYSQTSRELVRNGTIADMLAAQQQSWFKRIMVEPIIRQMQQMPEEDQ